MADAFHPVLWHLTADQIAVGSGTPTALPLGPEIPYIGSPDNVEGVVALSATRLLVVKYADGALYRIDLDPQASQGRTITPITGATVPLGSQMILDGKRLVVPDENGLSVVELADDAASGTVVTRLRDPSFRDATAVARIGDRYLVVNAAWDLPPPYTISSVPVVPGPDEARARRERCPVSAGVALGTITGRYDDQYTCTLSRPTSCRRAAWTSSSSQGGRGTPGVIRPEARAE